MNNAHILEIENLHTVFNGKPIHSGLSLAVRRGEILVLLGGSGTGKTTLLRTIVGLSYPAKGQCRYHDQDLYTTAPQNWPAIRRQIAYIFQGAALFDSLNVEENLSFPLINNTKLSEDERTQQINHILEQLNLGPIQKLYPAELSGGMQKRLGIARALMLNPQIILFDEPTAGLDPANIRRINDIILDLKEHGVTSIVITHDPLCAKVVADRFAFLRDGKIGVIQSVEEFNQNPHPDLVAYFNGEID